MKIRKQDLPRKIFTCENILYSLAKAINNKREGNYIDCNFNSEDEFITYLNSLEKAVLITKKSNIFEDEINLKNYIFNINPLLSFDKKKIFKKWLNENVVGFLSIITSLLINHS